MVERFHRKMGLTVGDSPAIREPELRARLILEEAFETVQGLLGGHAADLFACHVVIRHPFDHTALPDLPSVADGIADLIYVAAGTAVACGVDMHPVLEAVDQANMAKAGGGLDENGKLKKPEGWLPPDIHYELRLQGWKP